MIIRSKLQQTEAREDDSHLIPLDLEATGRLCQRVGGGSEVAGGGVGL